jgi:hypothetical protein
MATLPSTTAEEFAASDLDAVRGLGRATDGTGGSIGASNRRDLSIDGSVGLVRWLWSDGYRIWVEG